MSVKITDFILPGYREIPDVGLYLDQTVKYINRYLAPLGCMEITTSMVSNYVKKGYIASPVRKKYDAEQIAYLFFISLAKSVISMDNIARLFEMQKKSYTSEVAYNYFCAELTNVLEYTFGLKDEMEEVGTTNTELKKMLRCVIVAVAHIIYLSDQLDRFGRSEAVETGSLPENSAE